MVEHLLTTPGTIALFSISVKQKLRTGGGQIPGNRNTPGGILGGIFLTKYTAPLGKPSNLSKTRNAAESTWLGKTSARQIICVEIKPSG
jgi:hypothetical protein